MTGTRKNNMQAKAVLNLFLLIFFTLLFASGILLFILSRQTGSGIQAAEWLGRIGAAHTCFAFVVSVLVILHVAGNFKMFKLGLKKRT